MSFCYVWSFLFYIDIVFIPTSDLHRLLLVKRILGISVIWSCWHRYISYSHWGSLLRRFSARRNKSAIYALALWCVCVHVKIKIPKKCAVWTGTSDAIDCFPLHTHNTDIWPWSQWLWIIHISTPHHSTILLLSIGDLPGGGREKRTCRPLPGYSPVGVGLFQPPSSPWRKGGGR